MRRAQVEPTLAVAAIAHDAALSSRPPVAMAVGCGGPMVDQEAVELATQEAPLPDCSFEPNADLRRYYNDAAHTQLIGEFGCYCGGLYYWGGRSVYTEHILEC